MLNIQIDPIRLESILNKKPGKTVTAEEWNEILNLLVTQGNYCMDYLERLEQLMEDAISGKITGITVETNVTTLGGRPAEDYALKEYVNTKYDSLSAWAVENINKKQDKLVLSGGRAVCTNNSGKPISSSVTNFELGCLTEARSNIQKQIDNKLALNGKAADSSKLNGHTFYVQKEKPSKPVEGDIWISW